jgi:hypothetical protein
MSQINTTNSLGKNLSNVALIFIAFTIGFLGITLAAGTTSADEPTTIDANLNTDYFTDAEDNQRSVGVNPQNTNESPALAQATDEADSSVKTAGNECSFISDNLRIDRNNDQQEVLRLQAFLKAYEYDYVSLTGDFDASTLQAVRAFQVRHAEDILSPWGYEQDESTGYVYITTRQKINEIYCNQEISLSSQETQEIQNFRSRLANLRQQGASFENPQYLKRFDLDLANQTIPDTATTQDSDQTADNETNDESDQMSDNNQSEESTTSTESIDSTTTDPDATEDDGPGFFGRLFGSGDDQSSSTSTDEDLSTTSSTTSTSSVDRAATSVYSGVNSVVGFVLSPTFLLILLGLLILLLIATLLEDGDDEGTSEYDDSGSDSSDDSGGEMSVESDGLDGQAESGDDQTSTDETSFSDEGAADKDSSESDPSITKSADFVDSESSTKQKIE